MPDRTLFSLAGKHALIHRADAPLGLELACGLARSAATVWLCGPDPVQLEQITDRCRQQGCAIAGSFVYQAGSAQAAEGLVTALKQAPGHLDVFVDNSLHLLPEGWSHTFETIEAVLARTQLGLMLSVQKIGQLMADRGSGSIILVTDYGALVGYDPQAYDQAPEQFDADFSLFSGFVKGSVVNYIRQAAGFLGEHRVRCNALAFAPLVQTVPPSFEQAFVRHSHLKRLAAEQDVGAAAVFLAADASSYITGVTLPVDGGYTAK